MKNKQKLWAMAALAALTFTAVQPAQADEPSTYGPGMMGGYGPGMMGNYGPGQGGYGPGQGRYGPGMMGGYGYHYGAGMMGGGWGQGGMMGLGPLYALNLNEQQLGKVNQIRDESRRKNWEIVGKIMDEQARMRDLLSAEKRDPSAIGKQAMKIAELRRQILESSVDTQNRIEALLTKEQKDQMRNFRRGWMMDSYE